MRDWEAKTAEWCAEKHGEYATKRDRRRHAKRKDLT